MAEELAEKKNMVQIESEKAKLTDEMICIQELIDSLDEYGRMMWKKEYDGNKI